MAISSTVRKAGPFSGNGVATQFSFDFKVFEPDDVAVLRACALGVETRLVVGDYAIALNEDQNEAPGGVVTLAAPLAAGCTLVLLSDVPLLQPVDVTNQGGFYPDLLNDGLDRSTIQVQQMVERLGRTIALPVTAEGFDLALPRPVPGQLIGWAEGKLTNYNADDLGGVIAYGAARVDKFDGDGVQVSFALSASPGSQNNLRVSIDGVVQVPGDDFTWAGGTALTFAAPPPADTKVVVQYQEALVDIAGAEEAGAAAGAAAAADVVDTRLPLDASGATVAAPRNVPYKSTSSSSVTRTLQARLEDAIYLADYATGTPNSAALQQAINDAQTSGKTLYLTPSIAKDAPVVITAPCSIVGVGKKTVATSTAVNINWITIRSSDVSISNIYIDDLAATGGWDFTIDTGAGLSLERIQIRNITAFHSKGGLRDIGTGNHVTVDIDNYFNRILKGPHIQFTRSFAYLDINNSTADFNGSGAAGNFKAFSLTGTGLGAGSGGGKFKACHVLGEANSALTNQIGFDFTDYAAPWLIGDVTADSCGGRGYRFTRCNKIEGNLTASLNQDHAVTFVDCSFSNLIINGQGRRGIGGASASKDIVRFEAVSGGNNSISIFVGYLADPTGNHVTVVGTQGGPVNIIGGAATGATGRALVATGSSVVQWTGFVWNNNAAGNYDIASALHWVEGVFASGGRSTFNGPGAA